VNGTPEVHSDGEIWSETLWDMRQAFVTKFGEQDGSDLSEILVTDAMRLSPPEPSYLDMRNAILAADTADFGGVDTNLLWSVFAHRGMGFFAAAFGGDDVTPVENFNRPPQAGGATGAISGTVTDVQTGLPLSGVKAAFAGHATSPDFPEFLAATTGANGGYSVTGVPVGDYPKFSFEKPGFDRVVVPDVAISQDTPAVRSAALQRDWASKAGGATVTQTEPSPESDCDANFLIDQTAAGWETFQDGDPTVGPSATVKLPATVNVDRFLMDPSNTCGDGASASTAAFRLETSTDGITFRVAKAGTFTAADRNRLNTVTPDGTSGRAVRFVRLTLLSAQNEGPGFSGNSFVDFTELEVIGGPPNALPSGRLVPSATVVRPGQAVAFDASSFRDPDSRITGYDWDFDGNGTTDRHTAGPVTSFAYGGAGTFTARVHANDFRGGFGAAAATVRVVPAPAVVAPLPRLSLSRTGTRGRVAFRVTCAARCRVTARLTISRSLARRLHLRSRTVGTLTRTVTGTRRLTLRVRLSARARRAARRAGLKTVRATLTTRATYADGRSTRSSRKVRIRLR
jgi:YD repeat-containing protein